MAQDALEAIMSNGFNILVGDSDGGADKEIVDFLRVRSEIRYNAKNTCCLAESSL